jgi:hypothetical protein
MLTDSQTGLEAHTKRYNSHPQISLTIHEASPSSSLPMQSSATRRIRTRSSKRGMTFTLSRYLEELDKELLEGKDFSSPQASNGLNDTPLRACASSPILGGTSKRPLSVSWSEADSPAGCSHPMADEARHLSQPQYSLPPRAPESGAAAINQARIELGEDKCPTWDDVRRDQLRMDALLRMTTSSQKVSGQIPPWWRPSNKSSIPGDAKTFDKRHQQVIHERIALCRAR